MPDNIEDNGKDAAKLLAALKAERSSRKETEDKLKDSDAALIAANAKLAEHATLENPTAAKMTELVSASAKAMTAKQTAEQQARIAELETALDAEKKGSATLLGKLASRTIAETVRLAAAEDHVRPEAINDLLTFAAAELKLDGDEVRTQDGLSVAEWLDGRKSTSPYLWPVAKGAGARGSFGDGGKVYTGSNPWAKGSWNLTEQSRLYQSQPDLAKQLQAQVPG